MGDLRVVDAGARSTLYVSREGELHREYHDTGRWVGPLEPHVDDEGVARCSGNRRLDTVIRNAFDEEALYGSSTSARRKPPPPHVKQAMHRLTGPHAKAWSSVEEFAQACCVKPSSGWCYLCRVVEAYPGASKEAQAFVNPSVLEWLTKEEDLSGSLRELWQRCSAMRSDPDVRCLDDPLAHLRLGRLCVIAGRHPSDPR